MEVKQGFPSLSYYIWHLFTATEHLSTHGIILKKYYFIKISLITVWPSTVRFKKPLSTKNKNMLFLFYVTHMTIRFLYLYLLVDM